jgi:hypothetical protein
MSPSAGSSTSAVNLQPMARPSIRPANSRLARRPVCSQRAAWWQAAKPKTTTAKSLLATAACAMRLGLRATSERAARPAASPKASRAQRQAYRHRTIPSSTPGRRARNRMFRALACGWCAKKASAIPGRTW